jgi:hypothetical protein
VVAPRVAEVQAAPAEQLGPGLLGQLADALAIVDDQPEVAGAIRRLRAPGGEHEELVAHVEEGHVPSAATQLELEDAPVEVEPLLEVVDLEDDVVDADEARLVCHGT